jgi:PIN domain nuclease of toxin-antitoxin system
LKTLNRDETAPKHNDPFDRIMLAQAKTENYKFITHDTLISQYNEPCIIWL